MSQIFLKYFKTPTQFDLFLKISTHIIIVSLEEAISLNRIETSISSILSTNNHRQPFIIDNMLHNSNNDLSRFLVDSLVTPRRIDTRKSSSDSVVLTQEQHLESDETQVLISTRLTANKARLEIATANLRRREW